MTYKEGSITENEQSPERAKAKLHWASPIAE
jgi:hypothetical protein